MEVQGQFQDWLYPLGVLCQSGFVCCHKPCKVPHTTLPTCSVLFFGNEVKFLNEPPVVRGLRKESKMIAQARVQGKPNRSVYVLFQCKSWTCELHVDLDMLHVISGKLNLILRAECR